MSFMPKKPQPIRSHKVTACDWTKQAFANDGLDEGIYEAAKQENKTVTMMLEKIKSEKQGVMSPYFGLTLFETMQKKNELRARGQAVPLTAFEELLKLADIQTTGGRTSLVGKFFEVGDIDTLFPEYVSNQIYGTLLRSSLIPLFVATERVINSETFEKIYIEDTELDRDLVEVGRGEEFPETNIVVGTEKMRMVKYGRYLKATDEELKFQALNVFNMALNRIGLNIGIRQTDVMVYTMINGDGNSNTPGTTVSADTSTYIGTADVIEWANCLPTPYKMNRFIGKKALLNEYYTTLSGFTNFSTSPATNNSMSVVGIQLPMPHEWDRTVVTTDYFIGCDTNYAIEHVTWGQMKVETERLIRSQVNGTAVSVASGFAIIDENAIAIFDETA